MLAFIGLGRCTVTTVGLLLAIAGLIWGWWTGRQNVRHRTGQAINCGYLYNTPVTRVLVCTLGTVSLPVIAACFLWHGALSPLAVVLGWGAFIAGARHEYRCQVAQMASFLIKRERIAPFAAVIEARRCLKGLLEASVFSYPGWALRITGGIKALDAIMAFALDVKTAIIVWTIAAGSNQARGKIGLQTSENP